MLSWYFSYCGCEPEPVSKTIYWLFSLCKEHWYPLKLSVISAKRKLQVLWGCSHKRYIYFAAFNNAVKNTFNAFVKVTPVLNVPNTAPSLCPNHSDRLGRYVELCLAGRAISTGHCAFLTPYESWSVPFPWCLSPRMTFKYQPKSTEQPEPETHNVPSETTNKMAYFDAYIRTQQGSSIMSF